MTLLQVIIFIFHDLKKAPV